jgi:hypothetical protein
VLWTACLAANAGAAEGHTYLQRETVSLPWLGRDQPCLGPSTRTQAACAAAPPLPLTPAHPRRLLQGNLKAFTGAEQQPSPVAIADELVLAVCELHTTLEHLCLQQQFNSLSVITSALLQQPPAFGLGAFPVSVLLRSSRCWAVPPRLLLAGCQPAGSGVWCGVHSAAALAAQQA